MYCGSHLNKETRPVTKEMIDSPPYCNQDYNIYIREDACERREEMGTIILLFILFVATLVMAPWLGYVNQKHWHPHTDTMSGDEGED